MYGTLGIFLPRGFGIRGCRQKFDRLCAIGVSALFLFLPPASCSAGPMLPSPPFLLPQ